jgi:hypothetical protein
MSTGYDSTGVRMPLLSLDAVHESPGGFRSRFFRHSTTEGHSGTRMLNRTAAWHQSNGNMNINKTGSSKVWMYSLDWFHTVLHWQTWKVVLLIMMIYYAAFVVFAIGFLFVETKCGLQIVTFIEAFEFSVSTMMTIGYGLRGDVYMHGCTSGSALVSLCAVTGCLLQALCFGVLMMRITRPTLRASTIIFSDKAVIRNIGGRLHLMFQVCELRKHFLVQAKVSTYAIRRVPGHKAGKFHLESRSMRLSHPDDNLGANILLAFPSIVTHEIDAWSPLWPPSAPGSTIQAYTWPDVLQRRADALAGNRNDHECLACGARFNTRAALQHHRDNSRNTAKPGTPSAATCHGDMGATGPDGSGVPDYATLDATMRASYTELLVLVEGVDSASGDTIQARHSYAFMDGEIQFDKFFDDCTEFLEDGTIEVDFDRFHHLVEAPHCDTAREHVVSHA